MKLIKERNSYGFDEDRVYFKYCPLKDMLAADKADIEYGGANA